VTDDVRPAKATTARPTRPPRPSRARAAAAEAPEVEAQEVVADGEGRVEEPAQAARRGLPDREARPRAGGAAEDKAALDLARRVVDLAADKKAADIVLLGVAELTTLADYFVICSGGSERQLGAIADGIVEGLRVEGERPIGREGGPGAHWLLLDFGSVIVHILAPPERDFYQLEKLWSEAPTLLRIQ
jgi:ribosome-associated protein